MKVLLSVCISFFYINLFAQNTIVAEISFPVGYVRDVAVDHFTQNYKSHHGVLWDMMLYPTNSKRIGFYGATGMSVLMENEIFNLKENIYKYEQIDLKTYTDNFKLFFGVKAQNRSKDRYFTPHFTFFTGWYFQRHGFSLRDVDSQIKYFETQRNIYKSNNFIVGSGLGVDLNLTKYWQDKKRFYPDGAMFLGIGLEYFATPSKVNYIDNYSIYDINSLTSSTQNKTTGIIEYKSETLPFHKYANVEKNFLHVLGLRARLTIKFYREPRN